MTGEAWAFLGIIVTTMGAIGGAWVTSHSGKAANDAAEARVATGGPDNSWMSLTRQYDQLAAQLRAESSDLRKEVESLRSEVHSLRTDFEAIREYVIELVRSWGQPVMPTPTARVRRHLMDIFTRGDD